MIKTPSRPKFQKAEGFGGRGGVDGGFRCAAVVTVGFGGETEWCRKATRGQG